MTDDQANDQRGAKAATQDDLGPDLGPAEPYRPRGGFTIDDPDPAPETPEAGLTVTLVVNDNGTDSVVEIQGAGTGHHHGSIRVLSEHPEYATTLDFEGEHCPVDLPGYRVRGAIVEIDGTETRVGDARGDLS